MPEALPELRVAHAERSTVARRASASWLAHACWIRRDLSTRGATAASVRVYGAVSRARERSPLRDALAARAKTIKRDQEQSKRAERRHTHNVEKRLAEKAPVRAAPYIHQEGDFEPVEPEITEELQARAEAALGAAPTAMSFANTVARNFAAPEGAFPELSASPPAAPVAAAPASRGRPDAGRLRQPLRRRGPAAAGDAPAPQRRHAVAARRAAKAQAGEEDMRGRGRRYWLVWRRVSLGGTGAA